MDIEHYPLPADPNFQSKIYKKREFQYYRSTQRKKITNYEDLEKSVQEMTELLESVKSDSIINFRKN
jgi:hypothetical protein